MIQWEYQITIHELPERQAEKETEPLNVIRMAFVLSMMPIRAALNGWRMLFHEKGKKGWELVQSGYHNRELLCIWKKRKVAGQKG